MKATPISPIVQLLREIHGRFAGAVAGAPSARNARLAQADPQSFGLCLVTADGQIYEVGDTAQAFPMEALVRPFALGAVLESRPAPELLTRLGLSGGGTGSSPLTDSGAAVVEQQICRAAGTNAVARVLEVLDAAAGRALRVDEAYAKTIAAEPLAGGRTASALAAAGISGEDAENVAALHSRLNAVAVTCRDLGIMAATLANRGVNPVTGRMALGASRTDGVLSALSAFGMGEHSGEWLFEVGLPATYGAAGGFFAVLPGRLGLAVFSPALDAAGRSARGLAVCRTLARELEWHAFDQMTEGPVVLRLRCHAGQVNSSRVRTPVEARVLREHGHTIKIYQLQGHLDFATTEVVIREVMRDFPEISYAILDCKRVVSLSASAGRLLGELLMTLDGAGKRLVFTHSAHLDGLRRFLQERLGEALDGQFYTFRDGDFALEWCENRMMHEHLPTWQTVRSAALEDYELFAGLTAEELGLVGKLLLRRRYVQDDTIVKAGERADELFLLAYGLVSVTLRFEDGVAKRVATFAAGSIFGEMAMLDGCPRSANVEADTDCVCDVLRVEDFRRIGEAYPAIKIKMLENLGRILSQKLRKSNREITLHDR
jgi:glutaminase